MNVGTLQQSGKKLSEHPEGCRKPESCFFWLQKIATKNNENLRIVIKVWKHVVFRDPISKQKVIFKKKQNCEKF